MTKRETQIILKTDERKVVLELGLGGKFTARSTGCLNAGAIIPQRSGRTFR